MKKLISSLVLVLVGVTASCSVSNDGSGGQNTTSSATKPVLIPQDYTDDDDNCGAAGWVCQGGRTCTDSLCSPAWLEMSETDAPDFRAKGGAGYINDTFVVFGGAASNALDGTPLATAGAYDPSTDAWSSFPSLQESRCQFSVVSTINSLFVVGGINPCFDGTTVGPQTEVIYPSQTSWITMDNESPNAYSMGMTYLDDGLFIFGGEDNTLPARASAFILTLGSNWEDVSCSLSNCARSGVFSIFRDGPFVRSFGSNSYDSSADGLLFDINSKIWSSWIVPDGTPDFETVSPDGDVPSFVDTGDRLIYLNYTNNDILIYNKSTLTWSEDTSSPPSGFCQDAASAWTGFEMVSWSGLCDGTVSEVGGTYQPAAPGM